MKLSKLLWKLWNDSLHRNGEKISGKMMIRKIFYYHRSLVNSHTHTGLNLEWTFNPSIIQLSMKYTRIYVGVVIRIITKAEESSLNSLMLMWLCWKKYYTCDDGRKMRNETEIHWKIVIHLIGKWKNLFPITQNCSELISFVMNLNANHNHSGR